MDESIALVEFSKHDRSARVDTVACAHIEVGLKIRVPGFGNRDTDARAYARAGVADDRNFCIDARSRLTSRCGTLGFAGYDDAGLARSVAAALRSPGLPPLPRPVWRGARSARPPRPDLAGFLSGAMGGNDGAVDIYVQEKARPPPPPASPPPNRRSPPPRPAAAAGS